MTSTLQTAHMIGEFIDEAGGYFAGILNIRGVPHQVITAPKSGGELKGCWLKTYSDVPGAASYFDSTANTLAMAQAGSPIAKKALAALEVCTGRTTGAGVMRVRAIAEVREALAHVDQTNTSPERVQKTPGNVHVMQMALDALECMLGAWVYEPRSDANKRDSEGQANTAITELRAALAALAAPQGEPVAWASPGQLANLTDENDEVSGRYIPLRKTSGGKFTQPLYAAPQPAAPVQPAVCPEHDEWVAQGTKPCDNPAQCWEHCGQLGNSLEHAKVARPIKSPTKFMDRPEQPERSCAVCKHRPRDVPVTLNAPCAMTKTDGSRNDRQRHQPGCKLAGR